MTQPIDMTQNTHLYNLLSDQAQETLRGSFPSPNCGFCQLVIEEDTEEEGSDGSSTNRDGSVLTAIDLGA